jgi:hypothetical protein
MVTLRGILQTGDGLTEKENMCGSKRRAVVEAVREESRVIPRRRERAALVVDVSGCGGQLSCFFLLSVVADCNFPSVSPFLFIFVLSLAVFAASADACIASLHLLFNVAQFHVVSHRYCCSFNAPPPLVIRNALPNVFFFLSLFLLIFLEMLLYTYNIW